MGKAQDASVVRDRDGSVLSIGAIVHSTQGYQLGETIVGEVASIITARGLIEVLHQSGKDIGLVFRCSARLWVKGSIDSVPFGAD